MVESMERTANAGNTSAQLIAGAMGFIHALAAASIGRLDSALYQGRKPPLAWKDTPAESEFDLESITTATFIFNGSVRAASSIFPKNANVTATVALAGIGLDNTRVELFADPSPQVNQHYL
jgi:aspartate dehydrogenase